MCIYIYLLYTHWLTSKTYDFPFVAPWYQIYPDLLPMGWALQAHTAAAVPFGDARYAPRPAIGATQIFGAAMVRKQQSLDLWIDVVWWIRKPCHFWSLLLQVRVCVCVLVCVCFIFLSWLFSIGHVAMVYRSYMPQHGLPWKIFSTDVNRPYLSMKRTLFSVIFSASEPPNFNEPATSWHAIQVGFSPARLKSQRFGREREFPRPCRSACDTVSMWQEGATISLSKTKVDQV